jgi:outer membrane protein, heavy metal efflux system
MSKNNILLNLLILCFTSSGIAQVLPLDSVKNRILSQNPELKMFVNQAKSYDAMAEGATAWEAPLIGAGFFMTPYKSSYWKPQMMKINGMNTMMPGMGNFMIQAKQMIPNPSKLKANQRYQQAMSSVENENSRATANNMLFQAKTTYYEVQMIDRKLKVLDEAKNTIQTMIQLGERKIAYNQESLASVYKAKSEAALLEKDKWMMEGERKQKLYMLNGLMNRSKDQPFLTDTLIVIKEYDTAIVDSSTLTTNRSDLLAIDKNIQVALLKEKTELAKSRPDFGLEYGHMFAFGENPNQFTLMGMMSIPIAPWSSKMYKSSAKASRFEVEAMKNKKEAMVTESIGMLYGMKSELSSAKYQLKLYQDMILPALQKTYDIAMLAYANNTGELFMALDARMNLQMAQMQYWDTMSNLLKLQAEYEKQYQIF